MQNILSPVVTVHWDADFVKNFLRQGTRDETAFVCAGVAVNFYQHIGFQRLQKRNSEMVIRMALRLAEMWGTEVLAPAESKSLPAHPELSIDSYKFILTNPIFPGGYQGCFMACVRLPIKNLNCAGLTDDRTCKECEGLRDYLLHRYKIEASMIYHFVNKLWVRISCHVYNEEEDYIKLGKAVLDIVKHGVPFKFAEEGEGATHGGEGSS